MRQLISELPFEATEAVVEDALEVAADIQADAEELYETTPSRGDDRWTRAEDELNSLLAVHDTPRTGETGGGVVAGLQVAVNDIIAVRNLVMTCGSKECEFDRSTPRSSDDSSSGSRVSWQGQL